ncbi:hypothetical protein ABT56_12860 [Photobacterium aquae]|uniref:Uncharacterized protein n=1 Tax=Photobacterium aquae TaxID=1195763 RepID=A0A0J1GZL2_9GAMM|nr:hypothetical protein [Photobacterium aquae]KLV05086.1 hypothetical protein ABT56_12860 [Photobacterium aquae]
MDNIVASILLAPLGWITIPTFFFFALFFVVWLVLKSQNNELIQGRYVILKEVDCVRGLWFSMSSFMEEKAFLQLQNGWLKSLLKFIYPLYFFWDLTFLLAVVAFLLMASWLCFS